MSERSVTGNLLVSLAALVVVFAGMRAAQDLLVPFLLSGFIAIIAAPLMFWLTARRVPAGLALVVVLSLILLLGMLVGAMVGNSLEDFSKQLPLYQEKLNAQKFLLVQQLSGWGMAVPEFALSKVLDPGKAMGMVAQGLTSLGGLLTNTFLILLTVTFMLFEAAGLPAKLRLIFDDPERSFGHLKRVVADIKQYVAIKLATSLMTGFILSVWLWIIGLDYPLLWGTLAFFLNFVPSIGSVIAAVPPLLLALVQLGPAGALWTGMGYALVNTVIGNVIEPRYMGQGLGLSTLVVFLSLIFWGWILGIVGMFLSVPLTMTVKIILDSRDDTRWLAILLGPEIREAREPCSKGPLDRFVERFESSRLLASSKDTGPDADTPPANTSGREKEPD